MFNSKKSRNTGMRGMDDFDKKFNSNRSFIKVAFIAIFSIVVILIIIQVSVMVWAGSKVVNEVNSKDNNGSVAKTIGHFYKDFKSASEDKDTE